MGTEVLRPQDCLIERIRQPPVSINYCNRNKNHSSNTSRSTRKPAKKPDRSDKRRGLLVPTQPIPIPIPVTTVSRRSSSDDLRITRSIGITKEKVTILRRGESLDSKIMSQALAKKNERDDLMSIYAGSAFAVSPSPSALPIPSFSKKPPCVAVDDSATRDLRRLLRLE